MHRRSENCDLFAHTSTSLCCEISTYMLRCKNHALFSWHRNVHSQHQGLNAAGSWSACCLGTQDCQSGMTRSCARCSTHKQCCRGAERSASAESASRRAQAAPQIALMMLQKPAKMCFRGMWQSASAECIAVEKPRSCLPICSVEQDQSDVDDAKSWSWLQMADLSLML